MCVSHRVVVLTLDSRSFYLLTHHLIRKLCLVCISVISCKCTACFLQLLLAQATSSLDIAVWTSRMICESIEQSLRQTMMDSLYKRAERSAVPRRLTYWRLCCVSRGCHCLLSRKRDCEVMPCTFRQHELGKAISVIARAAMHIMTHPAGRSAVKRVSQMRDFEAAELA